MIRKIIKIDENKCTGCGLCVDACHEDAIVLINGKAQLLRDDYCDGLGDCLPSCPTNAISFEEREALDYDEEAVKLNMENKKTSIPKTLNLNNNDLTNEETTIVSSQLNQWPVQIKLVSPKAEYLNDSNLLIAADCTAYAYGNFHNKFMKNRITLIGCPKLDNVDYSEKLIEILNYNEINSITIVRMEVPCCAGIVNATKKALMESGKVIPWQIVTISTSGEILE
ncbi:4Fe-4S ferredoxin [Clostridium botulinum]|uniref:Iron-sulfur binding protein n=1 Tax=Clostridium botulinum (strain Eklund 17B / Type B) TaxID=935198 RepID=B2TKT5_CLOBB|nr:iron-sulfur binding protein [Clostridium botulinum B str. Eklund 17B (NRP)]MBY6976556.1 4Fe-4S binding protein [Clostridium botulinum]MBY7001511.1 4Fe-4S binding protein [Clostridium botulinum]MCR1274348.1 4Fe-4S binding protein [Clostridium botulinum]NFD69026.1 4Fe-4S ferredoxin [Clostridium botulinum]